MNISKSKQKELSGNIWKFAVHAVTNKRTYMPFLSVFLLTMPNATAKTIGLLTLVGQMIGFVFEIPSGYVSDQMGHKKALVLARVAMVLSTACYVFADGTWWFFVGSALLAIGWSFVSGTDSAFMHNTLVALGRGEEYSSIMGRARSVGFAVPIIFILSLSAIADLNFRTAFLVALIIDVVGLIAVVLMKNPSVEKYDIEEIGLRNFFVVLRKFVSVGWLPFIIAETMIFSVILGATMGFKNPYQEILGFSISMLGVLWAVSRFFISGLLLVNGWIYNKLTYKQFIILRALVFSISFLGIGLITNMWAVAALFILGNTAMWGLLSAESQYRLEFIKQSNSKATLLSVASLMSKVFTAGIGVMTGLLVVSFSFQEAFLIIGLLLVVLIFGVMVFIREPVQMVC